MTDLNAHTVVKPAPSVYARSFGDELVLLDFGRGDYFGLDPVGTCVWQSIEQGRSLGDVAREVEARYDVTFEEAFRDVTALLVDMCARGLVAPR
jgi:hypothetical protein